MGQDFLPICREDMERRKIAQFDFVYVIGDAYVDHPSFGHAIISRLLEAYGYTVGIISQPDWRQKGSIAIYGEPRLAFLVSAGNMDSMVNHYSVSKRRREKDSFSPGGVMGRRPDYATVVYGNLIRQTYKKTPILIGGVEASLRRLAHYDYWSGKVKRSILLDSGADILMYGMGERSVIQLAEALDSGLAAGDITFVDGTVYKARIFTTLFSCRVMRQPEQTRNPMPKAFIPSTAMRIPSMGNAWQRNTPTRCMWCRTPRQSPCPSRKWMMCTACLICAAITPRMGLWAASQPSRR